MKNNIYDIKTGAEAKSKKEAAPEKNSFFTEKGKWFFIGLIIGWLL